MKYPTEEVPDKALLYRRIPKIFIGISISPSVFSFQENGCSVNWERYSNPERTRVENARPPPNYYCVGSLRTGDVRGIELIVKHHPLPDENEPKIDNKAHCLITRHPEMTKPGKTLKYHIKLANLCTLIPID